MIGYMILDEDGVKQRTRVADSVEDYERGIKAIDGDSIKNERGRYFLQYLFETETQASDKIISSYFGIGQLKTDGEIQNDLVANSPINPTFLELKKMEPILRSTYHGELIKIYADFDSESQMMKMISSKDWTGIFNRVTTIEYPKTTVDEIPKRLAKFKKLLKAKEAY